MSRKIVIGKVPALVSAEDILGWDGKSDLFEQSAFLKHGSDLFRLFGPRSKYGENPQTPKTITITIEVED